MKMKRIPTLTIMGILCLSIFSMLTLKPDKAHASATHTVYFTESGVSPSGNGWSVTLNGITHYSTPAYYTIEFDNEPDGTYAFTVTPPSGYTASPASGSVTVSGSDQTVHITFSQSSATYSATIKAYCNTEGVYIGVGIAQDSSSTGLSTPQTFSGLSGSHSFTVPSNDAAGHPFKHWSTGQTSQTITVSSVGTYTAYYEASSSSTCSVTITSGSGGSTSYSCSYGSGTVSSGQSIHAQVPSGTQISLTANPDSQHTFGGWSTYGSVYVSNGLSASTTLTVNGNGKASADFLLNQVNLGVSIGPTSATIQIGNSVQFTASASGGSGTYTRYVWYWMQYGIANQGSHDSGSSNTYTFTPLQAGSYGVYVVVTDSSGNTAQSLSSSVTVQSTPYSSTSNLQVLVYYEQSGNPIQGATVTMTSGPAGQNLLTGTTDANGQYTYQNVKTGSYSVRATAPAYSSGSGSATTQNGQTAQITIVLTYSSGEREALVNGGFESGDLTGWTVTTYPSLGPSEGASVVTTNPHSGEHCAYVVGASDIRQIFQGIPVSAIQSVTYWGRTDVGYTSGGWFIYSDGTGIEKSHLFTNTSSWGFYDVTSLLSPGKILVGIVLACWYSSVPGHTYYDDVSILYTPVAPSPTYDVTINAHCNTEGSEIIVPITENGSPSGHRTPYSFQGLTGTTTFTVPYTDYEGHPFAYWDNVPGQMSPTLYVSSAATHTAYYAELPYAPQNVAATPNSKGEGVDLSWTAPDLSHAPSGYTVQWYYIYREQFNGILSIISSIDFSVSWFSPNYICEATTYHMTDRVQDDNTYCYKVVAVFQQGFSIPSAPVACARLQSLRGICSFISGVTSIVTSPSDSPKFTIQQNFYVFSGTKDAQGNPQVYWCQNCMQVDRSLGCSWSMMFVFSYSWTTGEKEKIMGPHPIWSPSLPNEYYFRSVISSKNQLIMTNSVDGTGFLRPLDLAAGAFISSDTSAMGSPRWIDCPNLVVVGPSGKNVDFRGGSGYVWCDAEANGRWYRTGMTPVPLGDATGETSTGLQWRVNPDVNTGVRADYWYDKNVIPIQWLEGMYFTPNFSAPESQGTYFTSSGEAVTAVIFSAHCPIYLDLYDDQGRCAGYNATSGMVEEQIPSVLWVSNQTLIAVDPSGTYHLVVTGTDNGAYELETSWQDATGTTTIMDFNGVTTAGTTQTYVMGESPNVVLTGIIVSKTVVGQGNSDQVNVTIGNLGAPDTSFDVALSANDTVIGTQRVLNLSGWNSTSTSFKWNTTGCTYGNYTLSVSVSLVPGKVGFSGSNLTRWAIVSLQGDITGSSGMPDGKVNILDISLAAKAYGSKLGDERFELNADLNNDGVINILDISAIAREYGRTA